jgi:hypothetical protein
MGAITKAIGKFIFDVVVALGAVSCILVWLKLEPKDIRMSVSGPHWLWLIVGLGLFVVALTSSGYSLYRTIHQPKPSLSSELRREMAIRQSSLLSFFAAQARDLVATLELTWHHWNNAGEKLIHPCSDKTDIKNVGKETAKLTAELRDFKVLYQDHLVRLKVEIPAFNSRTISNDIFSDEEYPNILTDLKDHERLLEKASNDVWDSAYVLEVNNAT